MGFWIFMLVMELLVPATMIYFGCLFRKGAPKEINALYGYRTIMSMKNKETWEFAHRYFGKIWLVCGTILLPVTVIAMLPVIGKQDDFVGTWGGIISLVQIIILIGTILPTEKALKKEFNSQGNKKEHL